MDNQQQPEPAHCRPKKAGCGSGGAMYAFGLIGAIVYYIQHAATAVDGLVGILKAIVWPAFLVYRLLEFLQM